MGIREMILGVAALNLAAFALYGVDKGLALRGGRRIRERTLLALAALFGGWGAALGMVVFHHKVSKPRFRYGVPAAAAAQLAALGWWLLRTVAG